MDFQRERRRIVVVCSPKIATYTSDEIRALGFNIKKTDHLHVETEGNLLDTMKLNFNLRTANRILFHLLDFEANNAEQLYQNLIKYPWDHIIPLQGYFHIQSFVKNPNIRDSRFANLKFKDAVADYFYNKYKRRPDSGPDRSKVVLFFHWQDKKVQVYLDTSGYRKISLKAPLIESLAAAIIQASSWNEKQHFINPMCGSGTLAIEAAMKAVNKCPGLLRNNYCFMHVKGYNEQYWKNLKEQYDYSQIKELPFKIIATDIDAKAISAARKNARDAGVEDLISFSVADYRNTPVPDGNGIIVFNPEYGERLGDEKTLENTYKEIGDFFKQKCRGYTGYIFTGNLRLAKKVGLRTKRRIEFYNGKIESRLLEYEIF